MLSLYESRSDRQNRYDMKYLRLLKKNMVRPLLKQTRKFAKTAGQMRRTADSEVIERLPFSAVVHHAALDAMADLCHLHRALRNNVTASGRQSEVCW